MYIDADLITDETSVVEAILAGIADRLSAALDLDEDESWEPAEGSPETSLPSMPYAFETAKSASAMIG